MFARRGGFGRVKVDVDDVVERANGDGDCFAKSFKIERAVVADVCVENDRAKIADGGLFLAAVESDFGAKIRRVDDSDVVLRRAQVAGILEGEPWMAGLEERLEHFLPEIDGRDRTSVDFAFLGEPFVVEVALLELAAVGVVQVRDFVRAKKRPVLARLHALHEQVRHPVGGVEVVGAASFVAGVDAQLEKIFDIVVPGFQVGTAGAAAFAALVDGHELVVVELEKGNDTLAFSVGALDVAAGAAHGGPRAAESAGPFGEEGIFGDSAEHDALDIVIDLVEVAARELAVRGARVEERWRARAEAARFVEIVEADDPFFPILLPLA